MAKLREYREYQSILEAVLAFLKVHHGNWESQKNNIRNIRNHSRVCKYDWIEYEYENYIV